ncbi:hypothetical protein NCS57_01329600 [Fusarium keratoplasticum]|uniref:Uncharacterized protein n=1 Tax=Fusarium keratoplasticum TaxID=1328300 RepID=A0ACC0QH39_9HYPO|nr:hypothetical protein NCS57_01329600 [Fusarium keratoplasticum]KAI8652650.1 hypothetical protein NCS57_01329600 [Fusarium keratoplasticum]KAI8653370.1 hypothetical protein NCS55_01322700 [Fusarium keratoplasticum]
MPHGSNVGYPQSYDSGDQQHYSAAAVHKEGNLHQINTDGYLDKNKIMNELAEKDIQEHVKERMKNEPGFAAMRNGNKPSRGAMVDAEIAKEEAEMLAAKRKSKKGSMGSISSSGSMSE